MKKLSHFLLGISFLAVSLFSLMPTSANAALVPCGRTSGTASEMSPCTVCHLVLGTKNLMDWGLKVMTFFALAVIVAMAIMYIVSTGNQGMMGTAKSGITAALAGFAIMLGAWLIVNTLLWIFGATIAGPGFTKTANSFDFTCKTASSAGTAVGPSTASPSTTTSTPSSAACEDIATAKTRMSSGGTVCNGTGACPSCNTTSFDGFITTYASAKGVSPSLIRGLIARESSCNPTSVKNESNGTKSCGLMQVNTGSSSYTCEQLKDPETGIKEGVRILAAAVSSATSMKSAYGSTVTVNELAAAIHNAGAGQSSASGDCNAASGWPTIPKWGCPINPGSAAFNACSIKSYACNVGAC